MIDIYGEECVPATRRCSKKYSSSERHKTSSVYNRIGYVWAQHKNRKT